MLLALGAVALAAIGILLAWYFTHRHAANHVTTVVVTTAPPKEAAAGRVSVPHLIGLKEQQALVRLSELGLRPKEVFKPAKQPKGVVVSQQPQEATAVRKGSRVTIVVDSGAPKVTMPDLTGQSAADARAALDRLGLAVTETKTISTQPPGTIVDQVPNAGAKIAKGGMVTLSVARGATKKPHAMPPSPAPTTTAASPPQPQTATMPDVGGQDEASAVQALGQAGILASLAFVPGSDPLGTVLQQAKPAGTQVPFHAHVQINISSGPGKKPQEQVPSVIGRTLTEAVSAMQGAHLRLIYLRYPVDSQAKAGQIVQQSPLGGGSAPQNAQVLVFLGAYQTS
jgi:serine/threonine-protein kinase